MYFSGTLQIPCFLSKTCLSCWSKNIFLHVLNMRLSAKILPWYPRSHLRPGLSLCCYRLLFPVFPSSVSPSLGSTDKDGAAVCTAVKGVMCPADFFPGVNNHPESTLLLSAAVVKTITHHNNNNNNKIIT